MKANIYIILSVFIICACNQPEITKSTYQGVNVTLKSPDNGDGTYTNPIIQADYSDPDVVKVGDNFFMTASSFACTPGLPILHSKDLVNWQLIGSACLSVYPKQHYSSVQHGNGIWAPSIRYHEGVYFIFYGDPDFGIYMLKADDPSGPWSEPLLIKKAKGWIDPCPFWDDDGNAYLVHAYAGSRAGMKSVLAVNKMETDGSAILDDGVLVFDGHFDHPTVEGPKFHKRNGYYYIFAPAGGVSTGWQLVLRSKNIYGPYEEKIVMQQGNTTVNGPHQGAWVALENEEDWFIHFQDQEAYGRVLHLQPMKWINDWPIIGKEQNGIGEPVTTFKKPEIEFLNSISPVGMNNEFNGEPDLLWQWNANKGLDWGMSFPSNGVYRIYCQESPDKYSNLWDIPSLYLQKLPARSFEVTAKLKVKLLNDGERCGFIIFGMDYAGVEIRNNEGQLVTRFFKCINARSGAKEQHSKVSLMEETDCYIKLKVSEGAFCKLYLSTDGENFNSLGEDFEAKPGRWIGSKFGFFAQKLNPINDSGWLDIDWVRYQFKND
ncbi:MAG: glycoside hydrolase 43 family protein [Labilibaculum sp.]|nr:glycoside hydrolase 43 family protein [Labilibaculum sp.]MBI9057495.1 glycoside hydrolase 43 family protein [Labilibaculum sp.]